jgi:hypothetical protein
MLSEFQVTQVWESMLAAETRALYFANLASQYTQRKQWISGISFFLSSAVAVSLLAKVSYVNVLMLAALLVGLLNAYSIAVGLDRKIGTMVRLHSIWQGIAADYNHLWNHTSEEDSESRLEEIINREREPSELAATEAPNDEHLLGKWQKRVFASYHLN